MVLSVEAWLSDVTFLCILAWCILSPKLFLNFFLHIPHVSPFWCAADDVDTFTVSTPGRVSGVSNSAEMVQSARSMEWLPGGVDVSVPVIGR